MPVWDQFVQLIEWGLRYLADYTASAGLAVIIFTILFKTVVLPLTVKAVRSTYGMQEIQPKIKELQRKYGSDRQRLSAETMRLYQEHGVSPVSGCLPMLLQMPIFFGLYFAIRHLSHAGVGVWGQGFLWLPSLAQADPYHILPILAGIFQFIQTRMTRPAGQGKAADPQQQMMNTMMMFTPLMVVVFGWRFDSGPVLYWAVSAVYSAVQQWFITGWGAMHDWFPWLPNLPEHRRLGYVTPEQREAAKAKQQKGLFARLSQQIQNQAAAQQQPAETPEPEQRPTSKRAQARAGKSKAQAPPKPPPDPNLVPRRSRSSTKKAAKSRQPASRADGGKPEDEPG